VTHLNITHGKKMEKTNTGVLLAGGEVPPLDRVLDIIRKASVVVAADSGYDYLKENGLSCDYFVGDMDSTRYPDLVHGMPSDRLRLAEQDKDETDTEMGLRLLWEQEIEYTVIIGGGGGRLDHLLGIVSLFEREKYPNEWYTNREVVYAVDRPMSFTGWKGETVSFFPVGNSQCRMRSAGLKWPLDGLVWEHGRQGISNIVTEETARVEPLEGRLICIRTLMHT
jgi:thiamine pyrophosphokinase